MGGTKTVQAIVRTAVGLDEGRTRNGGSMTDAELDNLKRELDRLLKDAETYGPYDDSPDLLCEAIETTRAAIAREETRRVNEARQGRLFR